MRWGAGVVAGAVAFALAIPGAQASRTDAPPTFTPPQSTSVVGGDAIMDGSPLSNPHAGARSAGQAIYDLWFYTLPVVNKRVSFSAADAKALTAAVDAFYNRVSGGVVRFRWMGFKPLPATSAALSDMCLSVSAQHEAIRSDLPLPVSPDASAAYWVVIKPDDPDCLAAAGLGWRSHGVSMQQPSWQVEGVRVLSHELGHVLGLLHSSSVVSPAVPATWPTNARTARYQEYGDVLDAMGIGGIWAWDDRVHGHMFRQADLDAHHLNMLGVLPASAQRSIGPGTSTTVTLRRVDGAGVRAVYLPWSNRAKFVLDFRPATYLDGQVNSADGPGAGIAVRMVDNGNDAGPAPYVLSTTSNGRSTADTAILAWARGSGGSPAKTGFARGSVIRLPDGTTIAVRRVTGSAAKVRIVRPDDVAAPFIDLATLGCTATNCMLDPARSLWDARGQTYDLPRQLVTDDIWVADLRASVDGQPVDLPERPAPGSQVDWGLPPLSPGNHVVQLTATDLAGNTMQETLNLQAPVADPPMDAGWWDVNAGFSFGWLTWEGQRCNDGARLCIDAAVRARADCPAGARGVFVTKGYDGQIVDTVAATTGPMRAGEVGILEPRTTTNEYDHWALQSLSCG